jgi:hypothetical protein
MNYSKTKSTKRFSFGINRNPTAKKAGSNIVTIATVPAADEFYSTSTVGLQMTVKEATALQGFLNTELGGYTPASIDSDSDSDSTDI